MTTDIRERVTEYIVTNHAPDLHGESIPDDYDLVATGVVDSLALLELIEWIQSEFGIAVLDIDISPEDFASVGAISRFVATSKTSNAN